MGQKTVWMLTYYPAGIYITMKILREQGIPADECHSTNDTVMNYTYIHLTKRCGLTRTEKLLNHIRMEHRMVMTEVFGYDGIGDQSTNPGSTNIQDHIVFQMLMNHYKEKNPAFSPFTDEEPVLKRGRLLQGKAAAKTSKTPATEVPFTEFDVVKKRRMMTESTTSDGDNDPDALSRFEEFEASVLDALTDISHDYQNQRYEELLQNEKDRINNIPPQKGVFYVAVSPVVRRGTKRLPKLGASRRNDPMIRLRELSRSVPYAFELVYYIKTFTPFNVEAEVHQHFNAYRIREKKGASTEFFNLDLETIGEFLRTRYPGEVIEGNAKMAEEDLDV